MNSKLYLETMPTSFYQDMIDARVFLNADYVIIIFFRLRTCLIGLFGVFMKCHYYNEKLVWHTDILHTNIYIFLFFAMNDKEYK